MERLLEQDGSDASYSFPELPVPPNSVVDSSSSEAGAPKPHVQRPYHPPYDQLYFDLEITAADMDHLPPWDKGDEDPRKHPKWHRILKAIQWQHQTNAVDEEDRRNASSPATAPSDRSWEGDRPSPGAHESSMSYLLFFLMAALAFTFLLLTKV